MLQRKKNNPSRKKNGLAKENGMNYRATQRALVVEDDLWMQPLITSALRSAIPGVTIDWVESAEEGLNQTRFFQYSIIVSDIHLKPNRKTGLDLWYSCREECPEVPILLTSSAPIDEFARKMGLYGPHYLPKPFNSEFCKEIIQNLVSHHNLTS
jgi:DNA-binding NtrC family response regulator